MLFFELKSSHTLGKFFINNSCKLLFIKKGLYLSIVTYNQLIIKEFNSTHSIDMVAKH